MDEILTIMKGGSAKEEDNSKSTNEKVGKKIRKNKKTNNDLKKKTFSREEMMDYDIEVWSRLPNWVKEMLTMMG